MVGKLDAVQLEIEHGLCMVTSHVNKSSAVFGRSTAYTPQNAPKSLMHRRWLRTLEVKNRRANQETSFLQCQVRCQKFPWTVLFNQQVHRAAPRFDLEIQLLDSGTCEHINFKR